MEGLPEVCIATTISFTTPSDACRLSVVSSMFKSAAESDILWETFLPENYALLIAGSSDPSLLELCPSKKQLFLHLSENPILIESGLKSFSLDKLTGKKCYMLSPRDLTIVWGDTPAYWVWIPEPKSRFNEVAELISVCWLEIRGKIKTSILSKNTCYTIYFVFQMTTKTYGFEYYPVEVSVVLVGGKASKRTVYLDTEKIQSRRNPFLLRRRLFPRNQVPEVQALAYTFAVEKTADNDLKERRDGWLEVEMGDFFNCEGSEDEVLEMCVLEVEHGGWKGGLIVHGIEIRPKESM